MYEHVLTLPRANLFGDAIDAGLPRSVSHLRHTVARSLSGSASSTGQSLLGRSIPTRIAHLGALESKVLDIFSWLVE